MGIKSPLKKSILKVNATQKKLSALVTEILDSTSLKDKINKASLKDISSFLKAATEILNSLTTPKSSFNPRGLSSPDSLEEFISHLNERDNVNFLHLLAEKDEDNDKEEKNS